MAPRRIVVVHAGFHKTGTTSVQALLRQHGKQIWPQHALVLPPCIPEVLRVATLHSTLRDPLSMQEFEFRFNDFLATLTLGKKRGLCISAEDLVGLIPGRNGHVGYEAAPALMATTARCLIETLGDDIDLTFYFSTRAAEPWLRSTYWQNLRGSRMTQCFESYSESLAEFASLDTVAGAIRDEVAPHRVITRRLEDTRDLALGPGEPVIDLLHLAPAARAAMTPVRAFNAAPPPDLLDAILGLNRSNLDNTELSREKPRFWDLIARKETARPVSTGEQLAYEHAMTDDILPERPRAVGRKSIRLTAQPRDLMGDAEALAGAWQVQVITLIPQAFPGILGESLIGKALKDGLWQLHTHDLRAYGEGKHRNVDDTPAGGGAGMVLRPDVVGKAIADAKAAARGITPVIYLSPRGKPFNQSMAQSLAKTDGVILLCGRFEGVDERVLEHFGVIEVSLGDFILTGGEIAAQALIDATVRLIPRVLGNDDSTLEESFADNLLEHPQYTKPAVWEGRAIPETLLSGHHANIAAWRRDKAERLTKERRPDLWRAYCATHNRAHGLDPDEDQEL